MQWHKESATQRATQSELKMDFIIYWKWDKLTFTDFFADISYQPTEFRTQKGMFIVVCKEVYRILF